MDNHEKPSPNMLEVMTGIRIDWPKGEPRSERTPLRERVANAAGFLRRVFSQNSPYVPMRPDAPTSDGIYNHDNSAYDQPLPIPVDWDFPRVPLTVLTDADIEAMFAGLPEPTTEE